MIAKDCIAVPQQVARQWGKGKCLAQFLSCPLRGWVSGHIEMQNATPVMGQNQKHVKDSAHKREPGFVPGPLLVHLVVTTGETSRRVPRPLSHLRLGECPEHSGC